MAPCLWHPAYGAPSQLCYNRPAMTRSNPIYVALDTTDVAKAASLARDLAPHVGGIKLGLEFFCANGPAGVAEVTAAARSLPLFLDLKLHDIPNTVAGALRAVERLRPRYVTIHATGGEAMMRAAADAAAAMGADRPRLLGVTVLTSLDDGDLDAMGVTRRAGDQVLALAGLSRRAGLDGIVCSPHEVAAARAALGADFDIVVPGIRPAGGMAGDQKRVRTPREALADGATALVIGRPITAAPDPVGAARAIAASLTS
jgi:orotidine-5'-phosphate decarboxylase